MGKYIDKYCNEVLLKYCMLLKKYWEKYCKIFIKRIGINPAILLKNFVNPVDFTFKKFTQKFLLSEIQVALFVMNQWYN